MARNSIIITAGGVGKRMQSSLPKQFIQIVKMSFNQRRKTIRNSIKQLIKGKGLEHEYLTLRPEVLSVEQFIELTKMVEPLV